MANRPAMRCTRRSCVVWYKKPPGEDPPSNPFCALRKSVGQGQIKSSRQRQQVAGRLFLAGKPRALIGFIIPDVKILVMCKENSTARAFVQLGLQYSCFRARAPLSSEGTSIKPGSLNKDAIGVGTRSKFFLFAPRAVWPVAQSPKNISTPQ